MSEAQYVIDLLKRERFFDLTGTDGCICAEIKLCRIYIDVHCHKSRHDKCKCEFAGIHITPLEPQDEIKLKEIGNLVLSEIEKMERTAEIVIHRAHNAWMYEAA